MASYTLVPAHAVEPDTTHNGETTEWYLKRDGKRACGRARRVESLFARHASARHAPARLMMEWSPAAAWINSVLTTTVGYSFLSAAFVSLVRTKSYTVTHLSSSKCFVVSAAFLYDDFTSLKARGTLACRHQDENPRRRLHSHDYPLVRRSNASRNSQIHHERVSRHVDHADACAWRNVGNSRFDVLVKREARGVAPHPRTAPPLERHAK